jgi:hypothetical protein
MCKVLLVKSEWAGWGIPDAICSRRALEGPFMQMMLV